jgi:hypothetical protein
MEAFAADGVAFDDKCCIWIYALKCRKENAIQKAHSKISFHIFQQSNFTFNI